MATLYIAEYADAFNSGGKIQVAAEPVNTEQTVAIAGASAQSAAFQSNTKLVRIATDVICSILFGTNPTATTAKKRMAADQVEYFAVPQGQSYKVAVISNT